MFSPGLPPYEILASMNGLDFQLVTDVVFRLARSARQGATPLLIDLNDEIWIFRSVVLDDLDGYLRFLSCQCFCIFRNIQYPGQRGLDGRGMVTETVLRNMRMAEELSVISKKFVFGAWPFSNGGEL